MTALIRPSGICRARTPRRWPPLKMGAAANAAGAPSDGVYISKSMSWTKSASTALRASRNARPSFVFRNGADPRLVAKSTFLATV